MGAPPWASALVVGVIVLAAGGLMVQQALASLRAQGLALTETLRTVRETVEWMADRT